MNVSPVSFGSCNSIGKRAISKIKFAPDNMMNKSIKIAEESKDPFQRRLANLGLQPQRPLVLDTARQEKVHFPDYKISSEMVEDEPKAEFLQNLFVGVTPPTNK